MKLWTAKKRRQSEIAADDEALHQAQQTVLDHRRPEVSDSVVSGEVEERVQHRPVEPVRLVTVLGRALVSDVSLCKATICIGRDPSQDIVLDDPSVSREHCRIRFEGDGYSVVDTGTANGMTINGHATVAERLGEGAELGIGCFLVVFDPTRDQLRKIDYRLGPISKDEARSQRATHYLSHEEIARIRQTVQEVRSPHLRLLGKSSAAGTLYTLRSRSVLGRGQGADIPLSGWLISSRHAEIFRDTESFTIRRLSRWRPIYVNGEPVRRQCRLGNRDLITIGTNAFQFGS